MREALLPVLNLVFMCLFQPKALLALCSVSLSLTTRSSPCHFSDSCWPQLSETVNTNTTLSPFASPLDAGVHLSHHCCPGGQEKEETGETNPPHSFVTSTWPLLNPENKNFVCQPPITAGRAGSMMTEPTGRKSYLADLSAGNALCSLTDSSELLPMKSICFGRNLESE